MGKAASGFCCKRWELRAGKFPKHRKLPGSQKERRVFSRGDLLSKPPSYSLTPPVQHLQVLAAPASGVIRHGYNKLEVHPGASVLKNPPAIARDAGRSLVRDDPLEKEIVTHSSILAWEIPWSEEPGALQSLGLQKSQT